MCLSQTLQSSLRVKIRNRVFQSGKESNEMETVQRVKAIKEWFVNILVSMSKSSGSERMYRDGDSSFR